MEPRPLGRGMESHLPVSFRFVVQLQWSHDLSVVECRPPARARRRRRARFNGATTSRSWNAARGSAPSRTTASFNGATTSRSWNGGGGCLASAGQRGFNGATTSRSWNDPSASSPLVSRSTLQWSHDLSVVEWAAYRREQGMQVFWL